LSVVGPEEEVVSKVRRFWERWMEPWPEEWVAVSRADSWVKN